jgi:hypothetical protein
MPCKVLHRLRGLVVVRDFHICWTAICPCKAHSKLSVDPDTVLASPNPFVPVIELLEFIARWNGELSERSHRVQQLQLPPCDLYHLGGAELACRFGGFPIEHIFRPLIRKANDHRQFELDSCSCIIMPRMLARQTC